MTSKKSGQEAIDIISKQYDTWIREELRSILWDAELLKSVYEDSEEGWQNTCVATASSMSGRITKALFLMGAKNCLALAEQLVKDGKG